MDAEALAAGVRWEFESFPDYLDCLDATPTTINVAAMVGHTPLRIEAMGGESMDRDATEAELDRMCALVAEARAAGGWGMATSLGANHVGPGGRPVPSFVGGIGEVAALARAMGSGVVEVTRGRTPVAELVEMAAPGLTISWSSLLSGRPGSSTALSTLLDQSAPGGTAVWPQISCRPINVRVMLGKPVALVTLMAFRRVLAVPEADRASVYRDPQWRLDAKAEMAGGWDAMWASSVALNGGVDDPGLGIRVGAVAAERGLDPFDALIDLALELGLDTRFDIAAANYDEGEVAGLLRDPRTIIGLSDAGAHTNQQCDASYATHLLGHWVRELGVLSLEQAVWRLTGQPAAVYGFADRGAIRPGAVADLVAFDPDVVGAGPLERVWDLPGGASRLTSGSTGIARVWVAGAEVVRDGGYVGDTPGRLLRRPQAA
jgi:N-acyl-D-aspartate/D-glutamate deacylase